MPKSLAEVASDPRFQDFTPEEQQDILAQVAMAHQVEKAKQTKLEPDRRNMLDLAKDWYNNQDANIPFLGNEKVGTRINGALAGGMAGAPFGLPGAGIGAAMGAAFPPKTPGELAASFMAGPLGEATGPLINKMPTSGARTGMAGLLSLLNSNLLDTTASATDMAAHAINPNSPEAAPPMWSQKMTPGDILKSLALQVVPAATGQALINNTVRNRPQVRSFDFANEQMGTPQLSQVPEIQSTLQNYPQIEKARQAGTTLPAAVLKNKNLTEELQNELGINKNRINKINEIQNRVDILRQQAEQQTYGDLYKKQAFQDIGERGIPSNISRASQKEENLALNLEKTKLKSREEQIGQALTHLKEQAASWGAMNPELRQLSQNSPNVSTLIDNLVGTTPEGLLAFRQHLMDQPNGSKNAKTIEDALVHEFFKRSYDPVSRTFKAQDLMKAGGPFNMDKVSAIYGGGAAGAEKAQQFQKAVNDIAALNEENSGKGMAQQFGSYTMRHLAWILPNILVFHPETLTKGGVATSAATAATAGLIGITYPKLVDMLLKSPALGDSFHRWATSTSRQGRSLANWPRLAAMLEQNGERIKMDEAKTQKAAPDNLPD